MPELFSEDGVMVNGLFGYCKLIKDLIRQNKNKEFAIIATFDRCVNNFRKEINGDYKLNRKKADSSLIVQLNLAEEFCKNINIPVEYDSRYEADDIIASIADKSKDEHEIIILSPDKDLMQLVDDKVKIFNPFLKKTIDKYFIEEKFGIKPEDFHIFLALCGDASDNIAGIEGIGPKTAVKILQKTKNVEEMQKLFPKFNFSTFNEMLSLTELYKEFNFQKINPYKTDSSCFNQNTKKFNFLSIQI